MDAPRLLIPLILVIAMAVTACEQAPRLGRGDAAPAFELRDLDGELRTFPEDFRDTPVVIRFWADWCRFCRTEMKDVEAVYSKHRDSGVVILAVNVGQGRDTARDFVKKIGISYDALLDSESAVAGAYGVVGLPTTYLVDRTGRIHAKILGESAKDVFERLLLEIL